MHISRAHEEMLPEGVKPMLMPDTQREAEILLLFLDSGLYPTVADEDLEESREGDRVCLEEEGIVYE